jgi:hypothetical protein
MPSTKRYRRDDLEVYERAHPDPPNLREIPGSGDPVHDDSKTRSPGTSILMSLMKPSPSGFI